MKTGNVLVKLMLTASFTVALFTACDSNRVYEKNTELPNYVWDKNNKLRFDVNIQDSVSFHNIYINVRNASSYQYSNLFLFVLTRSPKGDVLKDTVELTLANDKGEWLGEGLGDIWDIQIPYKTNIRFPVKGIYTIQLEQGMRHEKLPFIMDAGIRVERAK
jgi:gliding motility-associated lipoprotein GldH